LVGDVDHLKVFATQELADEWFQENDPEGVAFEYEVLEWTGSGAEWSWWSVVGMNQRFQNRGKFFKVQLTIVEAGPHGLKDPVHKSISPDWGLVRVKSAPLEMLKAVPHVVNHVARYMKVRFIVAIEAWKFDVRPERLGVLRGDWVCKGSKGGSWW
jgi:hypothetical protein